MTDRNGRIEPADDDVVTEHDDVLDADSAQLPSASDDPPTTTAEPKGDADQAAGIAPADAGISAPSEPGTFRWHPEYAGKTVDQVRSELAQQIASDQRQYQLAMDGAEESEHDALASVVTLERRWGPFDFDWAEMDATVLAARIVGFEEERERRQDMISWADYRAEGYGHGADDDASDQPAPQLGTGIKALSLLLVVLLILVILLAVWAL